MEGVGVGRGVASGVEGEGFWRGVVGGGGRRP